MGNATRPNTVLSPIVRLGLALTLLGLAHGLRADTVLGVYSGLGIWQQGTDGDLRSGISDVSVESDLGIDDDTNLVGYFALEHPLPVLPNVRFEYADTASTGDQNLGRSIEVNGTVFSVADTVSTEIELTQADAVFYYEVLDNYLSLDLGVAARYVDGRLAVASSAAQSDADFSGVLPMLYASAGIDLPLSGLWLRVSAAGVGYEGDQLLDVQARLGYESKLGLGLELGWRSQTLELEDIDDLDSADIELSGPYLMLNYHF